ncbi:MAG: AMP-binding protein, partial [Verrucomicrobiaceae bacterium]
MSTAAATKIKNATIYGLENVPSGGVLVIPSRLGFSDLLSLEKLLAGRALVYLTEQGASLPAQLKTHLETERVHALEIAAGSTNADALRREIQSEAGKGSVIIYVPSSVIAPGAPLCTVPGEKIDFLMQAHVPVLPLHVLHTNDLIMAIQRRRPAGEAILSFGDVLSESTVAAYQESLMLLAEKSFSCLPLLDMHLARALVLGLKKHRSHACLIDGKDEKTFGFDRILALAIVLSRHIRSVTKKARVGIILPPSGGAMVANVAVLLAGKVPVNLNFTAGRPAIESALKQADLDHYLTSDLFVRKVQSFPWPPNRQLTFIERLLPQKKAAIVFWSVISKVLPASLLAMVLGVPRKGGDSEATLLFTSGSSGDPKGVIMSHRNLMANICQFSSRLNLKTGDSILGCLPLFHCFGSTVTLWYPIVQGINVVTYPTPLEIKKLAELVLKHKITVMISTPTFLRGYLRGVNPEMLASLNLIVTGAEKLPKAVAEAFEARF